MPLSLAFHTASGVSNTSSHVCVAIAPGLKWILGLNDLCHLLQRATEGLGRGAPSQHCPPAWSRTAGGTGKSHGAQGSSGGVMEVGRRHGTRQRCPDSYKALPTIKVNQGRLWTLPTHLWVHLQPYHLPLISNPKSSVMIPVWEAVKK